MKDRRVLGLETCIDLLLEDLEVKQYFHNPSSCLTFFFCSFKPTPEHLLGSNKINSQSYQFKKVGEIFAITRKYKVQSQINDDKEETKVEKIKDFSYFKEDDLLDVFDSYNEQKKVDFICSKPYSYLFRYVFTNYLEYYLKRIHKTHYEIIKDEVHIWLSKLSPKPEV
jgi:hypothetical protein